jgi:hypothetical protein
MLNKNGNNRILYNFWRGHPNNDLLPVQEMQEILTMMCSPVNQESLRDSLQYLSSDRGDDTLLKEISLFLRRHTLKDELPEVSAANKTISINDSFPPPPPPPPELDMFLTHGVSHGLDLLCTATTKKDDVVLVERPTYFLAKNIFTSYNLRVQNLPMKKQSVTKTLMVDVEALGRGLKDGSIDVPRMIYIVPTHQNPTGK